MPLPFERRFILDNRSGKKAIICGRAKQKANAGKFYVEDFVGIAQPMIFDTVEQAEIEYKRRILINRNQDS